MFVYIFHPRGNPIDNCIPVCIDRQASMHQNLHVRLYMLDRLHMVHQIHRGVLATDAEQRHRVPGASPSCVWVQVFSSQPGDLQLCALEWHSEAWTQKQRGGSKTHLHTFNFMSQSTELCTFMRGSGTDAESSALAIAAVWKAKYATTVAHQKTKRKQRSSTILYLPRKNSEEVYHVILPVFFVVETKFCKTLSMCTPFRWGDTWHYMCA